MNNEDVKADTKYTLKDPYVTFTLCTKGKWEKRSLTLLYACLRSSRYLQGGGTSVGKLLALTIKPC